MKYTATVAATISQYLTRSAGYTIETIYTNGITLLKAYSYEMDAKGDMQETEVKQALISPKDETLTIIRSADQKVTQFTFEQALTILNLD